MSECRKCFHPLRASDHAFNDGLCSYCRQAEDNDRKRRQQRKARQFQKIKIPKIEEGN